MKMKSSGYPSGLEDAAAAPRAFKKILAQSLRVQSNVTCLMIDLFSRKIK